MSQTPKYAFILCAGKGTRLRPYTDNLPKPMVSVWDKPIVQHTVEKLRNIDVQKIIINLNYLGDRIESHFSSADDKDIIFSKEETLLDTGGGVKYALSQLSNDPFYLINGDAFWTEGGDKTALEKIANHWNEEKMDILLLLQPLSKMMLTKGVGDYDIDNQGRAIRSLDKTGAYMFAGIRITKPNLFDAVEENVFSFLKLMDAAQEKGTLYGFVHDADWHHISTPEDLDRVNASQNNEEIA